MVTGIKPLMATINTWQSFGKKVRSQGCDLLKRLDEFPRSILVTGCQRSGTTAVTRMVTTSEGMENYWFGKDDELDAALILSGEVVHEPKGRYCFQTTYLNECYGEYFQHDQDHRIIWVLRNPFSVVYSMLHNWGRFAFNELFSACGASGLNAKEMKRYRMIGQLAISRIRRGCYSYNGKLSQLFELQERYKKNRLIVIDYDDLVLHKEKILPRLYELIELKYDDSYANKLHSRNIKKSNRLSARSQRTITELCLPAYEKAKKLKIEI